MFNIDYIYDLLKSSLTEEGYQHFLSAVAFYVRKYNWPKTIVVSDEKSKSKFWTDAEIKELTHQFFEWIIVKDKLKYVKKIPDSYLSYYFSQMLMSFIADKIKEFQFKQGLSFEKVKELVREIVDSELIKKDIQSVSYCYSSIFDESQIKTQNEIEERMRYIPKVLINESTKQYRPLVKMIINDIFNSTESPISLIKLTQYVYSVFDQKAFMQSLTGTESIDPEYVLEENNKHKVAIEDIASGLSKNDAKLIVEYIFQSMGSPSLSELSTKYNIPKSSLHFKMENFKKKIVDSYLPVTQEDGLVFINKLAVFLDEYSK